MLFGNPKRLLATLIAGTTGLIVLIDTVGAGETISSLAFIFIDWAAILTALALLVGVGSVAASHIQRVVDRDSDWGYSLILVGSMLAVMIVGIVGIPGLVLFPQNLAEEPIRHLFHAVYEPLVSSLLALLAFFSLRTIIRASQRRSAEVFVMLGIALLVLIAQFPPIAAQPAIADGVSWINRYIALAGARGLLIGVAVGTLVAGMRVLLGFDQPFLD